MLRLVLDKFAKLGLVMVSYQKLVFQMFTPLESGCRNQALL